MSQHWDAFGVALLLLVLFLTALVAIDRGYTRSANGMRFTHRALRNADRKAYWRLHHRYTALCSAGVTVEQAAAEAEHLTSDKPIPYELVDADAYRPVFTEGEAS